MDSKYVCLGQDMHGWQELYMEVKIIRARAGSAVRICRPIAV